MSDPHQTDTLIKALALQPVRILDKSLPKSDTTTLLFYEVSNQRLSCKIVTAAVFV